ncbi:MAG: DNA polymerase III subunit chi [Alphaproteobacteria bacterium]|nr:DNA polymerase III subunit chi [Alphaproteobacteria bacterium]
MTEIRFYHLVRGSLEDVLPRMLDLTLERGKRAVVLLGSAERVEAVNAQLWTFDPASFLPHGSARDGHAPRQPVWLTHVDENPNGAAYLFVADGARSAHVADYERVSEIFDGRDEAVVADARSRWTAYKAAGHALEYWQQGERGGWEKKA